MTKFTVLLAFLFICHFTLAQDNKPSPILLDKEVLSGVNLRKIDLKDEPEKDFYQKMLFNGSDIMIFVVSTETWNNKIENYAFDEYVYLLNGQSIVKPKTDNAKIFNYGDHFFVPKNFQGTWEVNAGENLHYELSVISKLRTDSTYISKNTTFSEVERSMLSGVQLSLDDDNIHQEIIREGVELKLTFNAEKPQIRKLEGTTKEQLVHVLSGMITFTDSDNKVFTFHTGDFFVIPKGLEGQWNSQGHGIVKYLIVEKSDK